MTVAHGKGLSRLVEHMQKAGGRRQKAEDVHLLAGGDVLPRHLGGKHWKICHHDATRSDLLMCKGCDKLERPENLLTCQI